MNQRHNHHSDITHHSLRIQHTHEVHLPRISPRHELRELVVIRDAREDRDDGRKGFGHGFGLLHVHEEHITEGRVDEDMRVLDDPLDVAVAAGPGHVEASKRHEDAAAALHSGLDAGSMMRVSFDAVV